MKKINFLNHKQQNKVKKCLDRKNILTHFLHHALFTHIVEN